MKVYLLFFMAFLGSCTHTEKPILITDLPGDINVVQLKYAKGFEISQMLDRKRLRVFDLNNENKLIQQILIGDSLDEFEGLVLPELPQTAACNSTTHVSFFPKLGIEDRLIGTAWPELIMNPIIKSRIENGEVRAIGANGEINLEVTLEMNPDILMVYPYEELNYERYEQAGLNLVFNTEYQEQHPLAKAEWLKFYGVLFGVEEMANKVFEAIEKRYLEYQEMVADKENKPSVFSGSYLYGEWFAPGSASSTAQSIRDAGAEYIFEHSGEKNIQMDFEMMLTKVQHADFYGKLISDIIDLEGIRSQESRLGDIPAIKNGNIFYCNTSEADYFGDAIVEPEIVLADLISIFHPGTLPDHENKYFHLVSE